MACHPPHNNVRGESRKELVMNWISVKERLPELPKGISVRKFLCVTTSGEGHYTVDGVTFWDMDNLFVVRPQKGSKPYWGANPKKQPEVLYWKELPELPEELIQIKEQAKAERN
tara:strand:- start:301 stop:642 length:342 start_codon:yes stop_codon:yes gene_type:complete